MMAQGLYLYLMIELLEMDIGVGLQIDQYILGKLLVIKHGLIYLRGEVMVVH